MIHVVGKPAHSRQRLKQIGQYASCPGHRGLAITQNSPFSSLAVTVAIATHCAYPPMDGQAELAWVAGSGIDFPGPGVEPRTRSAISVLTGLGVGGLVIISYSASETGSFGTF